MKDKLKTLKDLDKEYNLNVYGYEPNVIELLRAEAIKDYKRLLEVAMKGDTLFKKHGKIAEGFEVNIFDYEQNDITGILKYIKWKFNLTDEELK